MSGIEEPRSKELSEALQAYAAPRAPADLVDRIMERVETEGSGRVEARRRSTRWALGAGIAAAAAIILLLFLGRDRTIEGSLDARVPSTIAVGERASLEAQAGARLSYRVSRGDDGGENALIDHHAGRVRYRVQPGGPFEVRTPAGVVRVTGTEFEVEVSDMTRTGKVTIGAAAAVLVTVSVITGSVVFGNEHGEVVLEEGDEANATSTRAPALGSAPRGTTEGSAAAAKAPPSKQVKRLPNREAWQKLSREIEAARQARVQREEQEQNDGDSLVPVEPRLPPTDTLPEGRLAREYIQQSIRDTIPLVQECYEMALEEHADLSGRLVVHFTIAGEEEVGGIVEDSEVEPDEGLQNDDFVECIRETFYSIEFPPPEGGGVVNVSYPLQFRSSDDAEE